MDYAIDNSFYMKAKALLDKIEQNQRLQQLTVSNGIDVKNSAKLTDATKDNVATAVIALLLARHNNDPRYNDLVRYGMDHRKTKIEIINDYKDQANQIITRAKNGNVDQLSGFTESYMEYDDSDLIQESQDILYEYSQIVQESQPARFTKATGYKDENLLIRILLFIPRLIANIIKHIKRAFSNARINSYARKAAKFDKITPSCNIALIVSELKKAEPILVDMWEKLDGYKDFDDFLKRAEKIKIDRDFVKFTDKEIEYGNNEEYGYIKHSVRTGGLYDYQKDEKGKEMTGKQYSDYILKFKDIISRLEPYLNNVRNALDNVMIHRDSGDPRYELKRVEAVRVTNNICSYFNAVQDLVFTMKTSIDVDLEQVSDIATNKFVIRTRIGESIDWDEIKRYIKNMFNNSRVTEVMFCDSSHFKEIFKDNTPAEFKQEFDASAKPQKYGLFAMAGDKPIRCIAIYNLCSKNPVDPRITKALGPEKMLVVKR